MSVRASKGGKDETHPREVLEHARKDHDVGTAGSHHDELIVSDIEVERGKSLGAERCREDGIEAVRGDEGQLRTTDSKLVTHLLCRRRCRQVLAITSLFDGSSTTSASSCTSPHLRKNSWLRREKRTSTEVMAKTTSLTLKVVGFGRQRTPCDCQKGQHSRRRVTNRTHLWQSQALLRERTLRVSDVGAGHVTAVGYEDDVCTR